MAGAIKIR